MAFQIRHLPPFDHNSIDRFSPFSDTPITPFTTSSTQSFHHQDFAAAISSAVERQHSQRWMHGTYASNPAIRVQEATDYLYNQPLYQDQSLYEPYEHQQDWGMYHSQGYSNNNNNNNYGLNTGWARRDRGHQRQASDSTIGSTGPDSPFNQTTAYPFIANNDASPTSATLHSDDGSLSFSKTSRNDSLQATPVRYLPSQLSHTSAAHFAMKNMAIDHHNSTDGSPELASSSSRRSVSSHGRSSPSTPRRSNTDEADDKAFKLPPNDYRQPPRLDLTRTESAACQDELYNPANFFPSSTISVPVQQQAPTSLPQPNLLTPHRNLVNERLRTANSARSQSPGQANSRARSPFRQGSPLAPTDGFGQTGNTIGTAAAARQQQKQQADAIEYAQHHPQLRREVTKTMSPQDAMLDYNDSDADAKMPLFNDSIPMGYQKHFGGSETFPNNFISGTNQAYGQFATSSQPSTTSFRASASSSAGNSGGTTFNFLPPAPAQAPTNSFLSQQFRPTNNNTQNSAVVEQTPDFPAHLTSMESSISENGAPASSQDSLTPITVPRPANAYASTGTYPCSSQGCTQRFDNASKLQKHKREAHPPQDDAVSSATASTSPRSSMSPGPGGEDGITSAALLARNSQAGPHKCTRINPSTGKPCNTIFSRPYDLTRHEDTIHARTKQKVRCQYCREDKTFSRNDALTRHMRVVHPEVDFQGKRSRKGSY